jgi:hypothetical protein
LFVRQCRCGVTFCLPCITNWLSCITPGTCPCCEEDISGDDLAESKALEEARDNLLVRCVHGEDRNSGATRVQKKRSKTTKRQEKLYCNWTGRLGDLHTHLTEECLCFPVSLNCPNASRGCTFEDNRRMLQEHIEFCEFQPILCKICGRNDITRRDMRGHKSVCYIHSISSKDTDGEPANDTNETDEPQFEIDCILAHRGDPMCREDMEFLVRFKDNDEVWLPYTKDVSSTKPYEDYVRPRPPLCPLAFSSQEAAAWVVQLNATAITEVNPGNIVFVDLRSYGADWYESLELPLSDLKTYVVQYRYQRWIDNKVKLRIKAHCHVFCETFTVNHDFVLRYGSVFDFNPDTMILVDEPFVLQYPDLMPGPRPRQKLKGGRTNADKENQQKSNFPTENSTKNKGVLMKRKSPDS